MGIRSRKEIKKKYLLSFFPWNRRWLNVLFNRGIIKTFFFFRILPIRLILQFLSEYVVVSSLQSMVYRLRRFGRHFVRVLSPQQRLNAILLNIFKAVRGSPRELDTPGIIVINYRDERVSRKNVFVKRERAYYFI